MKRFLITSLIILCGFTAFAQAQLSAKQSQEVTEELTRTAAAMQTLQCRFVQEKTMAMLSEPSASEGRMFYSSPDKMRWEYLKPYAFTLIVDGDRIVKKTGEQTEVVDSKSNRMYQGMISIIMGSATGKKLFDTSMFDVILYDDGTFWKAEMTPKRRDMKRMFSQLVFRFDKKTNTISRVEFVEAGGDVTSIRFEGIQLNEPIDEKVFVE